MAVSGRDRYRALVAGILVVLGVIIIIRGAADLANWSFGLLGVVLLALGLYRLNQVRVHLNSVRR